jgi:WD40 repeat protein
VSTASLHHQAVPLTWYETFGQSPRRSAVLATVFSPDGRTLATGSADRTTAVWNLAGQAHRPAILTGTKAAVWSVAFGPPVPI